MSKVKKETLRRIAKSLHRLSEFDKLDVIELEQLTKAFDNMPKHAFKNYFMGFLDYSRVADENITIIVGDGVHDESE